MEALLSEDEIARIGRLLAEGTDAADWLASPLAGCGSDRRFFRITSKEAEGCGQGRRETLVAVLPPTADTRNLAEARSSHLIGGHLYDRGVAVPRIHGFDPDSGLLLFEDLGDCRLHDLILRDSATGSEVVARYREALAALVAFQVKGRPGFREDMCWDTPRYDRQLMLERESLYFAREFCRDLLGFPEPPADLLREFEGLAARVGEEPADFLLHRDFQSQNLMIHGGRVRIVDFQGARFGPLAYDLASLLNDPYAGLPDELRQDLLDYYLAILQQYIEVDAQRFKQGYFFLALQRNLQVLGAYAFLSRKKGKIFFAAYIGPAAKALLNHLEKQPSAFPRLTDLVRTSLDRLAADRGQGS